jgi:tRNA threonylcarbamoyladenosine biosynthesis protein TsaB
MILLAVDTSSGQGSLALAREDGWGEGASLPDEWKSATLHAAMGRLLGSQGLKIADLDGYAVASGPGTFTGLRIGLTAVKAMAEVHGQPIVTISTLEVLAAAGREALPAGFADGIAPLMDARRGQVFGALYRAEGAALRPLIPDCVGPLQHILEQVHAADCGVVRICATEWDLFSEAVAKAGWSDGSRIAVAPQLAGTLARIGIERLRKGEGLSAEAAEANYVRPSDAELFWKG